MVIQRFRPLFSGQGEQVELLCRVLARRGVEATILTSAYADPTSTDTCEGYRVVRLKAAPRRQGHTDPSRLHGPVFGARVLGYLVTHGGFDVVHVHALTDALYTSWLWCRARRRPLVFEMTLVGADDAVSIMAARDTLASLRRSIFRRCDGYVAISPALEARCREAGLPPDRVRGLPQGVDVTRFRPAEDRRAHRARLGLPASGPVLVFVGSLIHRKGIDVLVRAWEGIHAARPDAHLVLVGQNTFGAGSAEAGFLEAQKARLPSAAAQHVHELGVRPDVSDVLRAADLFVFPSRREGFGTAMIEAMASGLPCIVAEQPGITDFVFRGEGGSGIVVPQDDDRAVTRAALELLTSPERAAAMGLEARRRAVDEFDIEHIADRYVAYYADLIAAARGRRAGR
jgi:glycosyltransferase involved in cell wall biosynthesis